MIEVFPVSLPSSSTALVDASGKLTTSGMALLRAYYNRTGQGTGLVNQVDVINASGSFTADWNKVTADGPYTLPNLTGGQNIMVQNADGNAIAIHPPSGSTIDGGTTPYSLAPTKMQIFWFFSQTDIFSTQLG